MSRKPSKNRFLNPQTHFIYGVSMGDITKKIKVCGEDKCKKVVALFDSGADGTTIREDLADELELEKGGK